MRCAILSVGLIFSLTFQAANANMRSMDDIASEYIDLALQLTQFDNNPFIYIGDKQHQQDIKQHPLPLENIESALSQLYNELQALPQPQEELAKIRRESLQGRLQAIVTRAQILLGNYPASFDEETRLMFGAVVPSRSEEHFLALIEKLDRLIPGKAPLAERMEAFRDQFVIPVDKLETVINTALQECRRRTKANLAMPEEEDLQVIIVQNKPFVGFTMFQGESKSQILINSDVPVHMERAVELGCHEAYPGHHTHGSLYEQYNTKQRGWIESTYFPLYGPFAVTAEGIANYGIDVAFPADERERYEREVILPLAGLSDENYNTYQAYLTIKRDLNYARNEAARMYLYGGKTREEAIQWLMKFGLETYGTASQRLDFIEAYRTYVICYNYGLDSVENFVKETTKDKPWEALAQILRGDITPEYILRQQQRMQ